MRWTTDEIAAIKQLKAEGRFGAEIAAVLRERFGCAVSRRAVLNALARHDRIAHTQRADERKRKFGARRALMQKLAAGGMSATQIARNLGETFARVAWMVPDCLGAGGSVQSWRGKAPQGQFERWLKTQARKPPPEPPVTSAGKLFADKQTGECAWWIGDDREGHMRFCAASNLETRSYCEKHYRMSIEPGRAPA